MEVKQEKKTLNIYQKILGVMSELKYIQKGSNKVNGMYSFVSHDQVTAAIHPLLVKHGIVIVPTVEEIKQEGNRTQVLLRVLFVSADVDHNCYVDANRYSFSVLSCGYGIDSGDKGPGKAISYAYKYALLKTFCLETGDDADNDANASYEPEKCLEFDLQLPIDMSEKDRAKLAKFLVYSAQTMKKHVEDVKREAVKRMPEFMTAFKNWSPKKEKE
jgi:hypothetical protein